MHSYIFLEDLQASHLAESKVCVHAYRDSVSIYLPNLDPLDCRLSSTPRLVDNISVVTVKDEPTTREVRTATGYRVAHFEREPVSVNVLNDADNPRGFELDCGEVRTHVA